MYSVTSGTKLVGNSYYQRVIWIIHLIKTLEKKSQQNRFLPRAVASSLPTKNFPRQFEKKSTPQVHPHLLVRFNPTLITIQIPTKRHKATAFTSISAPTFTFPRDRQILNKNRHLTRSSSSHCIWRNPLWSTFRKVNLRENVQFISVSDLKSVLSRRHAALVEYRYSPAFRRW